LAHAQEGSHALLRAQELAPGAPQAVARHFERLLPLPLDQEVAFAVADANRQGRVEGRVGDRGIGGRDPPGRDGAAGAGEAALHQGALFVLRAPHALEPAFRVVLDCGRDHDHEPRDRDFSGLAGPGALWLRLAPAAPRGRGRSQ
jgi:hypothetical protein